MAVFNIIKGKEIGMKRKTLVGLAIGFFLLGIVGAANATTIDFDDLTSGYYTSVSTDGVTITDLMGGSVKVLYKNNEGVGYTSPYNSIAASNWSVGYGLLFTFDSLVSNISLTGGDAGGDTDGWSMEAFDNLGNSLGYLATELNFSGADPVNPIAGSTYVDYRTLSLNVSGIKSLKVVQTVWGSSWDNLTFDDSNPVPEPSTMLLLSIGIVGIAGVSRKKFKK
jgi:hypothetical protein